MNSIIISIIVPVYNSAKTLSKCVESIITQSFNNFELLLIDDGSTDSSKCICDSFALLDARINVIHKNNGGVSSARNAGLDAAIGQWIVFADSDDWCEPDYLQDFFNISEKLSSSDIVLQGRKNEINGRVINNIILNNGVYSNIAEGMLKNKLLTFGAPYCKLYSNELIQKHNIRFPEDYSYGEDTTFFLKNIAYASRIITTNKCNYHYVDAEVGSLSKKDHEFKQLTEFLLDSLYLIKKIDLKSDAHGALVSTYFPNYKNLILRSIANTYRLGYSRRKKRECLNTIKNKLIPVCPCYSRSSLLLIKYTPTWLLIPMFALVLKLKR